MAYLGRGIENLSDRVVLDALTASATASYTLQLNSVNFVPSSASSLTVSLNGVIQKPESSYTVSSSTLTFSSALTSSDSIDFIIAERGITLQTPSAGSVNTDQLASTAVTTAKIANDAVTKDKVLNLMYPSFEATLSADTTISDVTVTLVPFDNVVFDTDSCYSTSTYKFTPNVAGKYYVYCSVMADAIGGTDLRRTSARIYKNDAHYKSVQWLNDTNRVRQQNPYVVGIIDMNGTSDNLSIYAYVDDNSGSPKLESGVKGNSFGAFRIGD